MADKKRVLIYSSIAVSITGIILTSLIVCKHNFHDLCKMSGFGCSMTGVDACSKLGESEFSKLFGWISISGIGFFYYSYLSLLFIRLLPQGKPDGKAIYSLILSLVLLGGLADFYFGIINFTVLEAPCILCAYTYIITALLLVIVFFLYKHYMSGENMKSILKNSTVVGKTVTEFLIALVLTVFLFVGFTVASNSVSSKPADDAMGLLPEDEVKGILSHLRSLTKAEVSTAGLNSMEGGKNGYIVIQKFADFRCPHCLHAGEILQAALKRWPGRIKIYYRHFPLDGTCNPMVGRKQEEGYSCIGAQAAICASDESYFADYYHGIFNFQKTGKNITLDNVKILTESLGGNWNKMLSCMGSAQTAGRLMRDIKDAEKIKLDSTPLIIVQDRMFKPGTPDPDYLFHILDALVYENEGKSAFEEYRTRTK